MGLCDARENKERIVVVCMCIMLYLGRKGSRKVVLHVHKDFS